MHITNPTAVAILEAANLLRSGALVAFPTETVYGLGGDATNDNTVAKIFSVKNRPSFKPLIVHGSSINAFKKIVIISDLAKKLAMQFWPGPLTMVLPSKDRSSISSLVSAGSNNIAVRVPNHKVALALLKIVNIPIVAPSANVSGHISPTTAQHVVESLICNLDMILDGGSCRVGIESTVIDLSTKVPTLLRPGGVTLEALKDILGIIEISDYDQMNSSLKYDDYIPSLPIRMNVITPRVGEALLAFGPTTKSQLNLSVSGDLTEAATNLFSMLRELDSNKYIAIAVMPIPEGGLGFAINDRLRRGIKKIDDN
ncbi:MAG: threonylcarbamoyl-AMP synthase [Rhodospirillaceae bacterium]|jgi:L-threonylcarbamoyladenylate synthase|nr:threonylcarbamoyl-AMP synthase [Rhodospirillaceae bacterium]